MSELDQKFVAIIDDWVKAYEADDPERVIDLYADDAVVAVQGRATVNGRTEIAALLRDSFVRYDRKVTVRYDRTESSGSLAYVFGRSWITLAPRDGSSNAYLFGRFAVVLRHCNDGRWRIVVDIDQPSADVDPTKPHFGTAG
ncbi:MAG: SgcJ/EcaC family oxidoreductase [Steroidobacteraceae bacterium]|nr:SgcJ/EcaC family oxidoreductase [Steroidobacteraceae bacterium]